MATITVLEASQVVQLDRETVRRWAIQSLVSAEKVGMRGDWRIDVDDLRRFAKQHNYSFNEDLLTQLSKA